MTLYVIGTKGSGDHDDELLQKQDYRLPSLDPGTQCREDDVSYGFST